MEQQGYYTWVQSRKRTEGAPGTQGAGTLPWAHQGGTARMIGGQRSSSREGHLIGSLWSHPLSLSPMVNARCVP